MTERDRLIELLRERQAYGKTAFSIYPISNEKIADHLLENGVIVPPCKVGDDIYTIIGGRVIKKFVTEVSKHHNTEVYFKYVPYDKNGVVQWFYFPSMATDCDIGKTVFLTKEEAEQALTCRKSRQDEQ